MKQPIVMMCDECRPLGADFFQASITHGESPEQALTCPRGHTVTVTVMAHRFQKLFERGVDALALDFNREAIGAFAASYERFLELFVRVLLRARGIRAERVEDTWKVISKQSERQLGAFAVLFLSEFRVTPELLRNELVKLRNDVTHQGYLATEAEAFGYGSEVLRLIRALITRLHESETHSAQLNQAMLEENKPFTRAPTTIVSPMALIRTNLKPESTDPDLEMMVHNARHLRQFMNTNTWPNNAF